MSFRRLILAITIALGLAFSTNIAAGTANACNPTTTGGFC
jgi:hypothetical protein